MDTTSPHLYFNEIESFSYNWLSDSADGGGSGSGSGRGSFIEMDPDFFSMRWSADSKHFDLNLIIPYRDRDDGEESVLSRSQSACSTKAPLTVSTSQSSPLFHSAQSTPSSACSSARSARPRKHRAVFFRRCTNSSPKKILWKYLCFLLPLCRKATDFHVFAPKPARSSRSSTFSTIEWCRGNADSAVYDAILYCKRSIGQDITEK